MECEFCGQFFYKKNSEIKRSKHNFCSPNCYYNWSSAKLIGEKKNTWTGGKMVKCYQCGKEIWHSPSKIKRNKHLFCSNACYRKWWSDNNSGKKSPNWRGGLIKRFCIVCHKVFWRYPSELKNDRGKYCSLICSRKERNIPTHHTKPELIFEQICKQNNLDFHYVGDGSLWIGTREQKQLNPDFIEANGKKICVEVFGDYWHSPLLNRNMKEHGTLEYRKRHYQQYKWQPVFIWESDLLREDAEQFVLNTLQKEGVF